MARTIKGYGWIPDLPDQRDFVFLAPRAMTKKLPAMADLRAQCPPVYDQGELGSCTANAIAAAHEFDQIRQQSPSRSLRPSVHCLRKLRVLGVLCGSLPS